MQRYPAVAPRAAKRQISLAVCVLQRVPDDLAHEWRAAAAGPARAAVEARLWQRGEFLLVKRPEEGAGAQNRRLLAGLWELPTAQLGGEGGVEEEAGEEEEEDEAAAEASGEARRRGALDTVLRAHGVRQGEGEHVLCRALVSVCGAGLARPIVHTFSHLAHSMLVEWMVVTHAGLAQPRAPAPGSPAAGESCWLREEEIGGKGASSAVAKVLQCARNHATRADKGTPKAAAGKAAAKGKRKAAAQPAPPSKSIARFFPAAKGSSEGAGSSA